MDKIRIGTRGSRLALWQAEFVATTLQNGGIDTEIIKIDTKGDKILDVSIAKIGSKGVFTEEIEAQLANGAIDIAVHSAKDMQSVLPDGFELIAFSAREQPYDVLVSDGQPIDLNAPGLTIGTASTRRVAMLKQYYPKITTTPVRGNLQTRIAKMKDGACDALMLAFAGVHRMGYENMVAHKFDLKTFTPPVGQGSVAVECATALPEDKKQAIKALINHPPTATRLLAERAFLRQLQGGCSIPVFGMATLQNGSVTLEGGIIALDGQHEVRHVATGAAEDPEAVGHAVAQYVLSHGGKEILDDIKRQL